MRPPQDTSAILVHVSRIARHGNISTAETITIFEKEEDDEVLTKNDHAACKA